MPLYEFRCPECGNEFEKIVFSSERGSVKCPKCGATEAERLLSVFSSSRSSGGIGDAPSSSCGPAGGGFS